MRPDAHELKRFYRSPLGRAAARSIGVGLSRVWRPLPNERLAGLGYALPWLDVLGTRTERTLALMPAEQGARRWPTGGQSRTAIVSEADLPFPDAALDRMLLVHALEHSRDPVETLREAYRALAANGRIVVVVPHRRGVWARLDHTPFGTGRPWSRGQLTRALEDAEFAVADFNDALMFPPMPWAWALKAAPALDWAGRKAFSTFSGAIVAVGAKRGSAGLPARARAVRKMMPAGAPAAAAVPAGASVPAGGPIPGGGATIRQDTI